jgi:hypothetical protein
VPGRDLKVLGGDLELGSKLKILEVSGCVCVC